MGAKSQNNLEWYRQLPQGGSCLLVDSRMSSRRLLLENLQNTNLFLGVVEAGSIADAKEKMLEGGFDACLISHTLKGEACKKLVTSMQEQPKASKCGIIVVSNSVVTVDDDVMRLAHRICKFPISLQALAETLVVGVAIANPESTWNDALIYLKPDLFEEALSLREEREKVRIQARLISQIDELVSDTGTDFSIHSLVTETCSVLDKLIEEYSGDNKAIIEGGGIKSEVISDIQNATNTLFSGFKLTSQLTAYKKYFASTLLEALIRVSIDGKEEAIKEFRKSILSSNRQVL